MRACDGVSKHRAYWRPESCVRACNGVDDIPCLLDVRVMRESM